MGKGTSNKNSEQKKTAFLSEKNNTTVTINRKHMIR